MNTVKLRENMAYQIALFLFSALFVFVYSTSTSFLYPYPETGDSFVFQTIGKFWVDGAIPYHDLFDNKGPFLYAMNALGYWLTDSRTGLLIVQIPIFYLLSVITFRFMRLGFNSKTSFGITLILLLGLSLGYNGGNNACEYGMPLLVLSSCLFYKWLQQPIEPTKKHPIRYSFVYGFTIGICLLTRASNSLIIFILLAYILFHELTHKQFRSLFQNLLTAAAGTLAICLPFVLYFYAHGALDDLYSSMISSNFHYLRSTGLMVSPMYLKRLVALLCSYVNLLALLGLAVLQIFAYFKKERVEAVQQNQSGNSLPEQGKATSQQRMNALLWLTISAVCILFFLRTNCYPNYAHICFPLAIIALLELKRLYIEVSHKQYLKTLTYSLTFIILTINGFNGIYTAVKNALYDSTPQKTLYSAYDSILKDLPKEGYSSFIGYDILPEMYLRWNIRPCYRFFALQSFSRSYNPAVYKQTNQEFMNGDAQWVLLNEKVGLPEEIRKVLAEKYVEVKRVKIKGGELVMFRRVGAPLKK